MPGAPAPAGGRAAVPSGEGELSGCCLTDLCGLGPGEAVASAVRTASTLTEAAVRNPAER